MNNALICQFAKWPDLGKVKTRIARNAGDAQAQLIHIELIKALMTELRKDALADYQLWLTRDDTQVFLQQPESLSQVVVSFCQYLIDRKISTALQDEGDLGYRMHRALVRQAECYSKVVVVGSDCPSVTGDIVSKALVQLEEYDVVIAPAEDGGFVLIAMNTCVAKSLPDDWLSKIHWGSAEVLEQTINACNQHDLNLTLLETLWDVDELEDYHRWRTQQSVS